MSKNNYLISDEASSAICPNDGTKQICCLNKKPTEIVGNCQESPGYKCLPILDCDTSDNFIKSQASPLLDIRSDGLVNLGHGISSCQGDQEICCKQNLKLSPASRRNETVSKFQAKCGRHNHKGLTFHVKNPENGIFGTQFGEWPFACLLYKTGSNEFIGGASLLTPGILLTAAHKVEYGYHGWDHLQLKSHIVR